MRDRLLNMPLMSLQTGTEVGRTVSTVIDPRNLSVVAFYCEGPGINFHPALLHTGDIREYAGIGLIIDSADIIMPTDDLVRLKEILSYNFKLEDKLVVDDHGHKVGKVINYTTDTLNYLIVKLQVSPPFFQSFSSAEVIIDRSQIISINDKKIIVKAPTIKEQAKHSSVQHRTVVDNPFRKTHAQPEASQKQ